MTRECKLAIFVWKHAVMNNYKNGKLVSDSHRL